MDSNAFFIFPCFTNEQIKEINKNIKKNTLQKEALDAPAGDRTKIGDFFEVPITPLMELLQPWLHQCQRINRDFFGYDVYWDFHLQTMNYNVYVINGEYDWHIDLKGGKGADMKLTCLLNLSEEPYEGGEFYMLNQRDGKSHPFNSGETLIFTSLLAHKVTPVTKGERITLTYWATGSKWN